jgi:hypothetical protein
VDLFSVTVHELGHSLGLMHSNIPDAIMFPYYRGYSKSIKLHGDDIAAIRKLYGGNEIQINQTIIVGFFFQILHQKFQFHPKKSQQKLLNIQHYHQLQRILLKQLPQL